MNIKNFISKEISQKQIAKDLNISAQTLNNYINEKTEPNIKTLIKLADYFNISIDDLVGHKIQKKTINKNILNENCSKIIAALFNFSDQQLEIIYAYITGLTEKGGS